MAEYYMPRQGSSYLENIVTWIRTGKRFRPRFPRAVQFQTLSTCNAKCVFCCHSSEPKAIPHGRMDDGLISKIIKECGRSGVGRVSPYMTNEPLMDKRMPRILADIKKHSILPVKTRITTNASLLTPEIGEALINAKLTQIWISVNGYSEETYRQSMSLDFARTMENIDRFLDLKRKMGAKHPKVNITTLRTRLVEHELEDARKYWDQRDVKFHIHAVDNRVGEETFDSVCVDTLERKKKRHCDLFLKQAYIVENGDMIICCHDWKQSVVVGNIANSSIREVWNSERFMKLIYEYFEGNFENLEICRKCGC
ncbi:radical SAM/SPASM domain-containing protein [Pseudodesulfovibrio pelocollis]|uniref:radical SAM/SPASM domain-containing protein n=1 Tax=Pseudodesulfovibrio pelocollis TaxID=3051432 RepID=UPI00255B0719|nr:radical SAM/SPASM domain-containing protein [Pseudodesulfovibrio sp. SB368]